MTPETAAFSRYVDTIEGIERTLELIEDPAIVQIREQLADARKRLNEELSETKEPGK